MYDYIVLIECMYICFIAECCRSNPDDSVGILVL